MGQVIVIKIGSKSLTSPDGLLDPLVLKDLCTQLNTISSKGYYPILVSSGAALIGRHLVQRKTPNFPTSSSTSASIGQAQLIAMYKEGLEQDGGKLIPAQFLINCENLSSRKSATRLFEELYELIRSGYLPVLNENDALAGDVRFRDNDDLASRIAVLCSASALILITNVKGVYIRYDSNVLDRDQNIFERIDPNKDFSSLVLDGLSVSNGGILSKLSASATAALKLIPTSIIGISKIKSLEKIAEKTINNQPHHLGTLVAIEDRTNQFIKAAAEKSSSRRKFLDWLMFGSIPQGIICLSEPGSDSLKVVASSVDLSNNLYLRGVEEVIGNFAVGATVLICDNIMKPIGCGVSELGSATINQLRKKINKENENNESPAKYGSIIRYENFTTAHPSFMAHSLGVILKAIHSEVHEKYSVVLEKKKKVAVIKSKNSKIGEEHKFSERDRMLIFQKINTSKRLGIPYDDAAIAVAYSRWRTGRVIATRSYSKLDEKNRFNI